MEKAYQRLVKFEKYAKIFFILVSAVLFFEPKSIEAAEIRLISDEETEQLLFHLAKPLFDAAHLKLDRNQIFIVDDPSLNAFVADGNRLFVHTGTIIRADNANELTGVIAHETGHIMGGHILRQKLKYDLP